MRPRFFDYFQKQLKKYIYILFSPPLTCQAKMDPWIAVLEHIPWHKMVFQLCYHVKEGKAMNNCLLIKLKKSSTKLTVGQLTADRLPTRTRRNGQQQLTNGRLQSTDRQLTDNRTTPDRQATGNGQTTIRRWTEDQQVTDNWQTPNKRAKTERQPKTTTVKRLASLIQTKYDRETAEETTHNLHFWQKYDFPQGKQKWSLN